MWRYSNPVQIHFADTFQASLFEIVGSHNKILVICSERFKNTEHFKSLKKGLKNFYVFTDIERNPSFESCQRAISFAKNKNPEIIISIGGGSIIDTAKAVRMAIYRSCYNINRLFAPGDLIGNKPIFIAIPTTHGSSSELTMWATVWDKINKNKFSLSENENYPDFAIYDTRLVSSLPMFESITSTLDALSHSFEAFWNRHSNPITDAYAIKAIKLIVNNLYDWPEPIPSSVRKELLLASICAGLAFSNTQTAAAHSISYPLSLHFEISHGIACSMSLYALLKINRKAIENKISCLLNAVGFVSIDELWERVQTFVTNKLPFSLHEYGIKDTDFDWLTELCFDSERIKNNCVDLSKVDIQNILKEIF